MKQSRNFLLMCSGLLLALCIASPYRAWAGPSPVAPINTEGGVALKGYDPVAYFTAGQPVQGTPEFTHTWKGVTYRFASSDNLQLFKSEPDKYAPQYGGYCAYAMAINRIADIDPDRWSVVEGKLYLNNNFFSHKLWSLSKTDNIASADKNWAVWPKTSAGE